jgi:hypothetical protein
MAYSDLTKGEISRVKSVTDAITKLADQGELGNMRAMLYRHRALIGKAGIDVDGMLKELDEALAEEDDEEHDFDDPTHPPRDGTGKHSTPEGQEAAEDREDWVSFPMQELVPDEDDFDTDTSNLGWFEDQPIEGADPFLHPGSTSRPVPPDKRLKRKPAKKTVSVPKGSAKTAELAIDAISTMTGGQTPSVKKADKRQPLKKVPMPVPKPPVAPGGVRDRHAEAMAAYHPGVIGQQPKNRAKRRAAAEVQVLIDQMG